MRRYRSPLIVAAALLTSAVAVTALLAATHRLTGQSTAVRLAAGKSVKPASAKGVKNGRGKKRGASTSAGNAASAAAYAAQMTSPVNAYGPTDCGKPVLAESFPGDTLNPNLWTLYNNPYGLTPRTASSVTVAGGYLDITGHYQAPYGYVSGGLKSNINQTYGCWVVRFRAQNGAGYEPVVLLWPEGPQADGEIDMAEVYPGSVLPVSTNRRGAGEFVHIGNQFIGGRKIPFSVNFAQWQTVAVDWLPNQITMYLNGKETWTVGTDYMGMGTDYIPNTPFHLAMQFDEGCNRDRCRPNSSTPSQVAMQVAWVKIYAAP
jgi:hypothetical protein